MGANDDGDNDDDDDDLDDDNYSVDDDGRAMRREDIDCGGRIAAGGRGDIDGRARGEGDGRTARRR